MFSHNIPLVWDAQKAARPTAVRYGRDEKERLMIICGVELSGSKAILAVIEKDDESINFIDCEPRKLELADDESKEQVTSFFETFQGFLKEKNVTKVVIKKRNKKGEYSGGPVSFKIEGLIQLLGGCEVELLAPTAISSRFKKSGISHPDKCRKYQHSAFEAAIASAEL